ncbi:cytochrome oxidase putative small subunit CydP [Burkholderia gladioli]|uniref:cytochrome oxidase putative small subunit CydP n=1 Tax=Burkholderia gladioli TaxID=28095 RepID=UPI0015E6FF7E|nr:cytochrome oxidase putative small subunit CydP [Burkholderia gladioli]MBA1361259.1 hypothetical protein [Burkholderia gladioli]
MPLILTRKSASQGARPTLRARVIAWARGPTLVRDLSVVLAVKLVLLMALKYAFFNHPQAEHMQLPPAVVAARLLGPTAPDSSKGAHHDQ